MHFLLYTERTHFYRRFALKGIRHLVFYQLPQNKRFFSEMCNLLALANKKTGSESDLSVTVIYNKYDSHRLQNVVGSDRTKTMMDGDKGVHMFMAGM